MGNILMLAIGMLCIVLGILNTRGNISSLHFYHRHRVSEANKPKFSKLVGLGTIIVGISCVVMSILTFISEATQNNICLVAGSVILCIGLVVGLGISFYAMIKYNKGIF